MLSIIIPVLNERQYTKQILSEIKGKTKGEYEVIIIDSMSTDETEAYLEEMVGIRYYRSPENLWVNGAWNKGVELANGEYIAILNNDLLLDDAWDEKLIKGLDGYKLSSPIYTAGSSDTGNTYKHNRFNKDNICGHCYLMRKKDWKPIPEEIKIWFGDNFIYNYIEGNQNCVEDCKIHHYESMTIKSSDFIDQIHAQITEDKKARFILKKQYETINTNSVTS